MLRRTLQAVKNLMPRIEVPALYTGERLNYAADYDDLYSKHRMRINLPGQSVSTPLKDSLRTAVSYNSFVAPCATLAGNVELWDYASVWYGCVVRGDVNLVRIGSFSNIQDGTVISEALSPISLEHDGSTVVGHYVTVGHGCQLRACTIEDECLVGMGSVLLENSYMETHSMLGAGSVLQSGDRIPSGELWVGSPAKFHRKLTPEEIDNFRVHARRYTQLAYNHKLQWTPHGSEYIDAEKQGIQVGWKGVMEIDSRFMWNTPSDRETISAFDPSDKLTIIPSKTVPKA